MTSSSRLTSLLGRLRTTIRSIWANRPTSIWANRPTSIWANRPTYWLRRAVRADLQDHTAQNSLVVLSGQLFRLALGLVSSALLARSLGPEGFSAFAVVGAVLMIATTVADFGLSRSAIRLIAGYVIDQPAAAQIAAGSFARLKTAAGLLTTGLLLLLAAPLARLLDLPEQSGRTMLQVAAVGLLAASLSGIPSSLLQALSRFKALVASHLLNAGLTLLLMVLLYLVGRLTLMPALWVGAITALATAIFGTLILSQPWRQALMQGALLQSGQWRDQSSRQLLAFGKWLWLSAILAILVAQADLLLVNHLLPAETAGHYALALNLAFKADILNQTLLTILLPAASALVATGHYRRYLGRSLARSLFISLFLLVAVLLAPLFIQLVYGQSFSPSVGVFRWLLVITAFDLIATPILLLAFPLNMPRFMVAAGALRLIVLLLLGSSLIPAWGLPGVVVAKLAGKIAGALLLGLAIAWRLRPSGVRHPDVK